MAWSRIFRAFFLSLSALSCVGFNAVILESIISLISSRICSASEGSAGFIPGAFSSLLTLDVKSLKSLSH